MKDKRYFKLLADYFSGEITTGDESELLAIWENNPSLKNEFNAIKDLGLYPLQNLNTSREASFEDIIATLRASENFTSFEKQKPKEFHILYKILAAASIIGICAFVLFQYIFKNKENTVSQIRTTTAYNPPKNNSKTIELPDHTLVIIGRNSQLTWKSKEFNKCNRDVYLKGEAYFDVTKNKRIPFIVHTKNEKIKVLGTAFNVKAYEKTPFQTTLLRGKIELIVNNSNTIILHPNDKVTISPISSTEKPKILREKIKAYNVNNNQLLIDTAWLQKTLIWDNTPLKEIALDMENYYGITVNIKTKELEDYRFTGSVRNDSLDLVLKTLSSVRPFHYAIDKKSNVDIQK